MILETAFISVIPGRESEFISALDAGVEVLKKAEGFLGIEIQRGVERNSTVLLTIKWATLENHTIDFREGPLFVEWRAVISPFFADAPVVEHWSIA